MSTIYADPAVLWQRVMKRVTVMPDGCWIWQGTVTSRGYGCIGSGRKSKSITTHRLAVIVRDGSIADGMTVDHLCHNRSKCESSGKDCLHRRCVNPDHLDVCDIGLNARRARHRTSYCDLGHEYRTERDENTRTWARLCECGVESSGHLPSTAWLDDLLAAATST